MIHSKEPTSNVQGAPNFKEENWEPKTQNEDSTYHSQHPAQKETQVDGNNQPQEDMEMEVERDNSGKVVKANSDDGKSPKEPDSSAPNEEVKEDESLNLNTNDKTGNPEEVSQAAGQAKTNENHCEWSKGQEDSCKGEPEKVEAEKSGSAIEHQHNITMSTPEENKLLNNKEATVPDSEQEKVAAETEEIKESGKRKEQAKEMLSKLRSLASNPRHGLKSKSNNIKFYSSWKKTIDSYKSKRFKQISLAHKTVCPVTREDFSVGIRRAQIVQLEAEKKKGFEPEGNNLIIQSSRPKNEISDFIIDENGHSKHSNQTNSSSKLAWELKRKKADSEKKIVKNMPDGQEVMKKGKYLAHAHPPLEPKDISTRTTACFENYLNHVGTMYYGLGTSQQLSSLNEVSSRLSRDQNGNIGGSVNDDTYHKIKSSESVSSTLFDDFYYSTLDVLWNPLRIPHVFENWSPREIAIFETWIWKFGKNFNLFSKFIKTKSTREVVDFYFAWKNTSRYKAWYQKTESFISEDHNDWIFK